MQWHELFPQGKQPTLGEFAGFAGEAGKLWLSLADSFETAYKARPKLAYSGCSGMPGWNAKFAKSGQAFGTW